MVLSLPFSDPRFPDGVKNLKYPPGKLDILCGQKPFSWPARSLAVIGSRNMSDYGKKVVWDLIPRIVAAGWSTVSGLAEGVDEEVARITLRAGGTTIGVLGFGVMKLNNFSNREVGRQIVNSGKGFLVSSFEPYMSASKWTFLERNRIIAALSDSLLIIEATQKSGCMSTVEAALELGKEVYAIPGSIFSYTSMGTNELIKQGARPLCKAEDLI